METQARLVDVGEPGKILVACLDNLGDLVFASSLVPPLARRFPRAQITLWCKEYASGIAPLIRGVHEIVACDPFWDRAPGRPKGRVSPFVSAVLHLRRERFDLALVVSPQWRAAAAVRATGTPVRVGRKRRKNGPWLTHILPEQRVDVPVLESHAALLDAIGVEHAQLVYALDLAPLAAERTRIAHALGVASWIGLHPFASDRRRCVAIEEWLAVARELEARGESVVWIGSPRELAELRTVESGSSAWHYSDQVTSGALREMAALLSLPKLFVGHDSGPMHVANAFGVPVVGIFAPGQPQRTMPQGTGPSRVLFKPSPSDIDARLMLDEIDHLPRVAR
jgi:heptosyltransferase II